MHNIPSARLTVPGPTPGEIVRQNLIDFVLNDPQKIAGNQGATKEQIYNAIWQDSEANNIKNLISVNLTYLKNDLRRAGLTESVLCREKHYFISRAEIECDYEIFERVYENFKQQKSKELAQKLLALYKEEYLKDFEAFWAIEKRIKYREMYDEAATYCLKD